MRRMIESRQWVPAVRRTYARFLALVAAVTLYASTALATPVGYMSWDVSIPGSTGAFDIVNLTGPNMLAPDFPISTTVSLSSLSLTVHFVGGGTLVFGSSYFTLSIDGISFNGGDIPIGGANPLPTDATLTGLFSPLFISLDGGGTETILPNFSASIAFAENGLEDGSFALIEATPSTTPAPEPETLPLLLIGIGALALARRTRQRKT